MMVDAFNPEVQPGLQSKFYIARCWLKKKKFYCLSRSLVEIYMHDSAFFECQFILGKIS